MFCTGEGKSNYFEIFLENWHTKVKNKTQSEDTKQASAPDSDKTQILELSNREFDITMISMLKTLMGKVDNVDKQMDNVSRDGNKEHCNRKEE